MQKLGSEDVDSRIPGAALVAAAGLDSPFPELYGTTPAYKCTASSLFHLPNSFAIKQSVKRHCSKIKTFNRFFNARISKYCDF